MPVKLAAGMLKPLVGKLGEAIQEQADDADRLVEEAQRRLSFDDRTRGLRLGRVFSSGSSSINGVKQMTLQCELASAEGYPQGSAQLQGQTRSDGTLGLAALRVQTSDGGV